MPEAGPLLGKELELTIGAVAQGGACVARHDGRVVFVRHALPGERVRARVVEDRGGSFCRADAVEVLDASPDRVEPPCPHAGPGRCGGCDFQHVSGPAQRELKAAVIREQFARVAHLELAADLFDAVEALPGGLLGWRTRVQYAVGPDGRPGLRRHHSHQLEPIGSCPLGVAGVGDAAALDETWPGLSGVEVVVGDDGDVTVLGHTPGRGGRQARGRRPPDRVEVLSGPPAVHHDVAGRGFDVSAGGFWQVHPHALATFTAALLDGVRAAPGETVLDLYAGAGALTAALADAVGPVGRVVGVESDRRAVDDAVGNLVDLPQAEVRRDKVSGGSIAALGVQPDVVVLDPPRAGAGREVIDALIDLAPRVIGYVSCDPATLARDVATAASHGWQLASLRAFDAFPMTHHVECIATLLPPRLLPSSR